MDNECKKIKTIYFQCILEKNKSSNNNSNYNIVDNNNINNYKNCNNYVYKLNEKDCLNYKKRFTNKI